MTKAREHAGVATPKRSRAANLGVARNASTGQFQILHKGKVVSFLAADELVQVLVSKAKIKGVAHGKQVLGKTIWNYAEAAAKARRTGKTVVITYLVTPDGKAEAVTLVPVEELSASPLDAAIARAKGRGADKVSDILKGADMLTAREFGPLIGTSHETVNIQRKRHAVLGLQGATRGLKYPRWQVTDDGLPLPGLPDLFEVLGDQPWTVYRFLRTTHSELSGRTALDALKAGQIEAVLGVARNQTTGAFA